MSVRSLVSGWTVIKEVVVSASSSKVFRALTRPRELDGWFTRGAKVDLRVGGKYSNLDHDKGKFLEIIPGEGRFTWDNPEYAPGSVVEVLLKTIRRETIVTLVHSGFRRRAEFEDYASGKSGWNWALSNLKAYLEGHGTLSFEEWLERK